MNVGVRVLLGRSCCVLLLSAYSGNSVFSAFAGLGPKIPSFPVRYQEKKKKRLYGY